MMGLVTTATLPLSTTHRYTTNTKKRIKKPRTSKVVCNFGDVVRKDMEFLKKGVNWASQTLHIPKLSKTVNDFIWLRHLEDPTASFQPRISWPHPFYPGLTGMDLFMADLKALEAYGYYIHYLSKTWSKPLPEVYDPQEVEDYFSCRPHLVTLRLLEVFLSFTLAAIKLRTLTVFRFWNSGVDNNMDDPEYLFGNMLKETLLNLGPTFIKVGQSLSTRPDIIGSEISKALSELHDGVPPFPRSVAMQIIEEELGSPIESVFSYISDEPVAAASFGQVYRGITLDGHNVAIKVQRPNLRHVVVRDIYLLRIGLGLVQKVARRKSDLCVYADELGKGLVGELDYTLEAANASEFREAHSPFPYIFVPRVYGHLSRTRVLTMEWLVGENPNDLLLVSSRNSDDCSSVYSGRQALDAKKRLLDLVTIGVEAALTQLLETGLLHADPHPGNLRYMATGQIGFLDFGLICRMEKKHQFAMLSSIVHIVNGDWAGLVNDLTEMDVAKTGTSIHRLAQDLEDALGEVETKDGIPDIKFSRVLAKIWSVALKYHFRMPPYYTLVFRSLASLEGLAVAADQDFKTFDAAFPYVVRKLLTDNSAASRKILHSVVFNKRKELQWQKLSLFLRMGVNIKGVQRYMASNSGTSHENAPTVDSSKVANLVVKLLPSKDGMVLRRLLMTADEASLLQAMVSREAIVFRKQVTITLADILYQWMTQALRQSNDTSHLKSGVKMVSGLHRKEESLSSGISTSVYDYHSVIKDRRLQLICRKVLEATRRQPILMLKCFWASVVMFLSAFALACHKILVTWSDKCIASLSLAPRMIAFTS